jgi:hypothetical protein
MVWGQDLVGREVDKLLSSSLAPQDFQEETRSPEGDYIRRYRADTRFGICQFFREVDGVSRRIRAIRLDPSESEGCRIP